MGSTVQNSNVLRDWQTNGNWAKYKEYVNNLGLTVEDYKKLDDTVHEAMRKPNLARELVVIRPVEGNIETQEWDYDTLSHMSSAQIADLFSEDVDIPDIARTKVHIPIVQKGTEINPRNAKSFINAMGSAAKVAMDRENEYIIQGLTPDNGTTYPIPGLYQGAGLDESSALDWTTATNIEQSIIKTIALLNARFFYGPFNLTLNSVQYNEARVRIGTTARTWLQWIQEQIGGMIRIDDTIVAGTGLMLAVPGTQTSKANGGLGGNFAEYIMTVDWTHEQEVLEKSKNKFGRVYSAGRLIYHDDGGGCKMSNI